MGFSIPSISVHLTVTCWTATASATRAGLGAGFRIVDPSTPSLPPQLKHCWNFAVECERSRPLAK